MGGVALPFRVGRCSLLFVVRCSLFVVRCCWSPFVVVQLSLTIAVAVAAAAAVVVVAVIGGGKMGVAVLG